MVPKRPNKVSAKLQEWAIGRRVWALISGIFKGAAAYFRFFVRLVQSPFQKMPLPVLCVAMMILGLTIAGAATSVILDRRRTASEVVVIVRGVPLSAPQFYRKLETHSGRDVIGKLTSDAYALSFAQSIGAMPTNAEVEAQVKIRLKTPGWTEFATEHRVSTDDLRYQFRLQLAREKAVRICNERATAGAAGRPAGARYVDMLADYRKSAKVVVNAGRYESDFMGRVK